MDSHTASLETETTAWRGVSAQQTRTWSSCLKEKKNQKVHMQN